MIRYSVVIPVLKTPTVHRTIEALRRQDFGASRYEVIVAGMLTREALPEGDPVRFYALDVPLSPAAARNRGAASATGQIIAFTDADCIPAPDWLSVLEQRFSDPSVAVVGGGVAFEQGNYWTLADNIGTFHEYLTTRPSGLRSLLPSLNLAIRRDVFLAVGGFDERYPRPAGEDSDLCIRLRRQGHRLHFEPRAVVTHAPPRDRFIHLLRHGYCQGKYSVKVDPRYRDVEGLPAFMRTRPGVLLSGPAIAAAVTLRIMIQNAGLWRYWYTLPAIFCSKLFWCIGAANHPWRQDA